MLFDAAAAVSGIGREKTNAANFRLYAAWSLLQALMSLLCGTSTAFSKWMAGIETKTSVQR